MLGIGRGTWEGKEGPITVWVIRGGKTNDGVRERMARSITITEIIRIHLCRISNVLHDYIPEHFGS